MNATEFVIACAAVAVVEFARAGLGNDPQIEHLCSHFARRHGLEEPEYVS